MFITLEGIEGSGKTTQIDTIVASAVSKGYACVTTREPGGTAIGTQIRSILLDPGNQDLDAGAELLLYVADRVQHLRQVIEPHLAAGRVVVSDRFFDATLVYQGYARGMDLDLILSLHRMLCDGLQPDATLLFDLAPEVGLQRAWQRIHSQAAADPESRFEQETIAFHRKVRQGYLTLARLSPERFRIVDAAQRQEQVAGAVEKILATLLPDKRSNSSEAENKR